MCEYNKRLYISLPLQAKKASTSLSMCEHKKRIYMSLALDEQKKTSSSISMCEYNKRLYISLPIQAKKGVGFSLYVRAKKPNLQYVKKLFVHP